MAKTNNLQEKDMGEEKLLQSKYTSDKRRLYEKIKTLITDYCQRKPKQSSKQR